MMSKTPIRRNSQRRGRRGAIAVELMILGPVVAMISLAASGATEQPALLWATCGVLSIYLFSRLAGDVARSR